MKQQRVSLLLILIGCFIIVGSCTSSKNQQAEYSEELAIIKGDGNVSREAITYSFLKVGGKDTIVDFINYAVPGNAAFPSNTFEGLLELKNLKTSGKFLKIKDRYNYTDSIDVERMHLPPFKYEFVQSGSHIIPLERGYLENEHPEWEYILEPGRVWNEENDKGYSRAAIPFTLKQKNQNCVHNGVMMFLFKNDGDITNVSYQVASETCAYFQFNMWGTVEATYSPLEIQSKEQYLQEYVNEVAMRMPTKPISELSDDFPGANPKEFSAPKELDQDHMTLYGFVIDGTNYVGGCETRFGTYPYCDVLVVPSYSTAKSISAGLGLMRLEKEYPGSKNAGIKDLIGACEREIWEDVSLENALDMATGNYVEKKAFADESSGQIQQFFSSEGHQGKIDYSCAHYPRKASPGTEWVYHTTDTYILGTAMNSYLKKATNNPDADYFEDLIVEDILKPIGTSPTNRKQQRTYDSVAQPFSGFGLFFHHDDAAKIGQFLNDGAIWDNRELLDKEMFEEVINPKRDSSLVANKEDLRYDNGFWFFDVEGTVLCTETGLIPYMAGYGGIKIILLPNNTIYYYFSDNFDNVWKEGVYESNRIRPFCKENSSSE